MPFDNPSTVDSPARDSRSRPGKRETNAGGDVVAVGVAVPLASTPSPNLFIATTLNVARSNVSNSIYELNQWGLIRTVHVMGDRREHYESLKDVWETFRNAVNEQKRREIDPVYRMLDETVHKLETDGKGHDHAKKQINDMLEFFKIMSSWYDDMKGIPLPVVKNFLKLGSKVIKMLGLLK